MKKKTKKTFTVRVVHTLELEIDQKVFDAVDDDWRKQFYSHIKTEQQIANHIGYNYAVNGDRLSDIDGFANLPPELVRVAKDDAEIEE